MCTVYCQHVGPPASGHLGSIFPVVFHNSLNRPRGLDTPSSAFTIKPAAHFMGKSTDDER